MKGKRNSIFWRKESTGKPAWGADDNSLEIVGEGYFWKKGTSIPRTWRRRSYKIRKDAVLFYFDSGKLRGCLDVTDVQINTGSDKSHASISGLDIVSPIAAELFSIYDNITLELVFDGKESTDRFCMQLMKVSISSSNIEKFVRNFHWKEANRLLGDDEFMDDEYCRHGDTTLTSVNLNDLPDGKLSWGEGVSLLIVGEGEFWKKGQRVKNWKRRHYKVREDAMLFYFECALQNRCLKPKGSRSLSSVSFKIGVGTNLIESGAIDFSVEDAVPVELTFGTECNRFMEIVFDNLNDAKLFVLAVSKVTDSHNIPDFLSEVESSGKLPKFGVSGPKTLRDNSSSATELLLQGHWLKRGRVRNVLKKREFKIYRSKDSPSGQDSSVAKFEYLYGDNGYFKKTVDILHIMLRSEQGAPVAAGDISASEVISMEIVFLKAPCNFDDMSQCAGSIDTILPFALEELDLAEKFCDVIANCALSSNAESFKRLLKSRSMAVTIASPERSVVSFVGEVAKPFPPVAVSTVPASTDFKVVYEGVFIKRTKVMGSWKSRSFKLKKSDITNASGGGFAQLEYKTFGGFNGKLDISDVTLTLKDGAIKIDRGDEECSQFSIYSNIDNEKIDVAMFGRHDVDVFCGHISAICPVHNVEKFLSDFYNSPQGRKRKAYFTYLRGTFLRQGFRTNNWKRKQYRICKVVDSTIDPSIAYGILQFGPEQTKPSNMRGFIILNDINVSIDSTICPGSDAIVIKSNDAPTMPIEETHRKLVLILEPHGCREGSAAKRERERVARESSDSDDADDAEYVDSSDDDVPEEISSLDNRTNPSVEEICTFLQVIGARSVRSNAKEVAQSFRSQRGGCGMRAGKATILLYICSGMLVLATLWVFFMPSLTALAVLMIFIGMLGVFVGNDFSSKEKISQT